MFVEEEKGREKSVKKTPILNSVGTFRSGFENNNGKKLKNVSVVAVKTKCSLNKGKLAKTATLDKVNCLASE